MKERCEIDLSPGTRAVPESEGERRAVAGLDVASCAISNILKVWMTLFAPPNYHGGAVPSPPEIPRKILQKSCFLDRLPFVFDSAVKCE